MGDMVTDVCVKFNYNWFDIDKTLENFQKSDNNKNSYIENNVPTT